MRDQIRKFLLDDRSARVSAVEMQDVWHEATARHCYPPAVQTLLGELMCAATLLASNLKFDGSLLLQLQGQGPIRLIVVECRSDMSLRATVKLGEQALSEQSGLRALVNPDGNGRFSVILNPPRDAVGQHPYQGIVSLDSDTVAEAIEQYMLQSEQLSTQLWFAVGSDRITGLMLQRMPVTGGNNAAQENQSDLTWQEAQALCATLTSEEMACTRVEDLLAKLFWQRPVLDLESKAIHWHCGCTRERVSSMLQSLGQQEVSEILKTQGQVEVTCEFCGERYGFDQTQAQRLFSNPDGSAASTMTIH